MLVSGSLIPLPLRFVVTEQAGEKSTFPTPTRCGRDFAQPLHPGDARADDRGDASGRAISPPAPSRRLLNDASTGNQRQQARFTDTIRSNQPDHATGGISSVILFSATVFSINAGSAASCATGRTGTSSDASLRQPHHQVVRPRFFIHPHPRYARQSGFTYSDAAGEFRWDTRLTRNINFSLIAGFDSFGVN